MLVAGHDSATLNGIRMALEEEGIVVCGRVASAAELIDAVTRLEPNVCLVDVDIPGGGLVAGSRHLPASAPCPVREPGQSISAW